MASPSEPTLVGSLHGLPVYRESFPAEPSDDNTTAKTVQAMAGHIKGCARDPAIQAMASRALTSWGGVGVRAGQNQWSLRRRQAWACFWAVKHSLRFEHHEAQLAQLLNEPGQQQLLIAPSVAVRMDRPAGDCAIFTMLVCCLLKCLDVPYQIVTVKADPGEPERWSHVYAVAIVEDGRRVPLDASHGKYPGWEIPPGRMLGYQAWDSEGFACEGRPAPVSRLNGYRARGRRGLGQDGADPLDAAGLLALQGGESGPNLLGGSLGTSYPSASSSASSFNIGSFIQSLANQGLNIVGKVVAPTTTLYNPQTGQYLSTPAGSTAASSLLSASQIGTPGIGTIVLVGGGLIAVLLLVKALGK